MALLDKASTLLGAIRSRRQAAQAAALTTYDGLVRALAAGRGAKPEEAEALLATAGRSVEDLEADTSALVKLSERVAAARQVPAIEGAEFERRTAYRDAETKLRAAEAALEGARAAFFRAGQDSTEAKQRAESLLRLVPAEVAGGWRESLAAWHEAALARDGNPSEALARVERDARAAAERAWSAVLGAAQAAPLEAVRSGSLVPAPQVEAAPFTTTYVGPAPTGVGS